MAEDTIPANIFERAMKALMDADTTQALFERADRGSLRYNGVADQVRAVLQAIREPSDAMSMAGYLECADGGTHSAIFGAMIDAALAEGA